MLVDVTHSKLGYWSCLDRRRPIGTDEKTCDRRGTGIGRQYLSAFLRDERGGITIFLLVLFIMLLVVGGMAVDYQRHEAARADLQDALDRGSLAAANLNQAYVLNGSKTRDEQARDVINEFMASRNFKQDTFTLNVSVDDVSGGREVTAAANVEIQTIFLSLVGIDTLSVNATSKATHAAKWLEIMLVLDITGSMTSTSQSGLQKIEDLKIAAKNFIDMAFAEGDPSHMTISILPFSMNVNLPRPVADLFDIDRRHDYGESCIDFREIDFSTNAIPLDKGTPYEQAQHFREYSSSGAYGCPRANNAATIHSNNATDLKNAIDAMTSESYTAMYMGTKWAAALLDPAADDIVDHLIATGSLSSDFDDTPRAWDDSSVRKIIVLMSDGRNTRLNRINDITYAALPLTHWHSNQPGSSKYAEINNNNDSDGDGLNDGDEKLKEICDTVKASPTAAIYTIGFEIAGNQSAQAALENCASDPSNYYLVEGVNLTTAFENIWNDIYNLKLMN